MACESSSSSQMTFKYDVFVSFRGEDTRNNFTDHLFGALRRKGIVAFRDDTKLNKGKDISPELMQAIEGSRVFIVVFSKNYASSTWCLQELAKMVDCFQEPTGHTILPVFYNVDPSEVRKQTGNFQKAFEKHEERFKDDLEIVQRWRKTLTEVGRLSGWDLQNKPQYAEIEKIVQEVTTILGHKIISFVDDQVGMHSRVEQLEQLLVLGAQEDVRVVGICGMGGIGKTTLATALYDRISHRYDACCFVHDVSKIYGDYGAIGVQKQLLCQALNEENQNIYNICEATYSVRTRLHHMKALIILDNVDRVEQLEKLSIKREWLGAGSRIILISRDEHILKEYGVDGVYNVQLLNKDDSLQLFCRKAFKCDDIMRGYKELTYAVLAYANGLPLAIKVLGSFLFGRDASEWRSALVRIRESASKDIMDVLRISFDGLENMDKEIFLDIACFFKRHQVEYVKEVLDCCGFHAEIGIRFLIEKSLITISHDSIEMHDLLQELGRQIVRENSPKDPRKWSRLWFFKDFQNIMLQNTEIEIPEAIVLRSHRRENSTLRAEVLSKITRLRLLILNGVEFSGNLNFLSNELRYIEWDEYPFTHLPSSIQLDKLVTLILTNSSIKQLWKGTKLLHNLRCMNLCHSKNLIKMPSFREVPNLEQLYLEGCIKLVQIDSSIGLLRKLAVLNLKNCKNLVNIPNNILNLSSLEFLNLSGCSKLSNNQLLEKSRHVELLEKLDTNESTSTIRYQATPSIFKILISSFHFFNSRRHEDSVGLLLSSLPRFPCLQDLDLSFCNVVQIPDAIGWLHGLARLNLGGNNFTTLPCSIKHLSKLRYLNLEHCKQLKYLPELPSTIVLSKITINRYWAALYMFNCPNLSELERCYNTAFSWMIQIIKVHVQSSLAFHQFQLVIPGSQIPRWFNQQNVGSSISMDPAPIMCDNNWIGIVCSAIFVVHDDPTQLGNEVEGHIGCGFETESSGIFTHIMILLEKNLVTLAFDHLLLLFFPREEFDYDLSSVSKGKHDLDGIKMGTTINNPQGLRLEVKNCGYRWVFKEDLEQLNPTMMHNGNSSVRKRKFLTIEDRSQPYA